MLTDERLAELRILCDLFPADTVADSHLQITDLRQLLAAVKDAKRMREAMEQLLLPYPEIVNDSDFYAYQVRGVTINKARKSITAPAAGATQSNATYCGRDRVTFNR